MKYKVGFDIATQVCKAVDFTIYADAGCANNDNGMSGLLWGAHGDGCYQVENYRYKVKVVRTARPAVTWLRAPGMLQASHGIEHVIDNAI